MDGSIDTGNVVVPVVPMTKRSDGWGRLDEELLSIGEVGFLDSICGRIALGEHPFDICQSKGIPWHVVRKWMEDEISRMEMFALAKRCYADKLAWDSIGEAVNSTMDTLAVDKFRGDTFGKMAGKMDPVGWGERKETVVLNTMNGVDAALDGFALALLERMRGVVWVQRTEVVIEAELVEADDDGDVVI